MKKKSHMSLLCAVILCLGLCAAPAEESTEAQATAAPVRGYVLVTTSTMSGWLPLAPEGEEYVYPLVQLAEDGTELVNHIHLTDSGVYMEYATCDNQDCVEQGMVTLENRETRVLYNWIICLPNQVALQLFTPEEVREFARAEGENTAEQE